VLSDEMSLRLPLDGKYHKPYSAKEFQQALKQTEIQLESLQQSIEEKLSDVASLIFTAQILMLKDNAYLKAMTDMIELGVNPPDAIIQVTDIYVKKFNAIANPYFQEKSHDIRDIGTRLLENIVGEEKDTSIGGQYEKHHDAKFPVVSEHQCNSNKNDD
jgi:phosphoenolpyruvate-protein kinase (PTS system EI component)